MFERNFIIKTVDTFAYFKGVLFACFKGLLSLRLNIRMFLNLFEKKICVYDLEVMELKFENKYTTLHHILFP